MGGGGGGGVPQGFDRKGVPLYYFDIHLWLTDLKNFLKAPLAPIYTNFEGDRENLGKIRVFIVLWESSENTFGRPKRKSTQKKVDPPREIPRSTPAFNYNLQCIKYLEK